MTAQNNLDSAVARLGTVESEVVEGMARIEASERRVVELRTRIERAKRMAEEDVAGRLASFGKFEERYWEKERQLHARVGY
jgi:multidrug resistance efflux pump